MSIDKNNKSFVLVDKEAVSDFVFKVSSEMHEYLESHNQSTFILFYKTLTHSDLATFGKATKVNSHNKNLLYYMTTSEMEKLEKIMGKPFQTAHQSCIGLKSELYDLTGLPQPRENSKYCINDYMNVYLMNKNMNYFTSEYTHKVFDILGKKVPKNAKCWNFSNIDVKLSHETFTPISMHVAVHGLGMEMDTDFHKIRHHLFKGDTIILLFELINETSRKNGFPKNNMFVLFEKNPIFFSIIGETNLTYVKYQNSIREKLISKVTAKENAIPQCEFDEEVTRQEQSARRNMLANEMMAYTQEPRQVFCPLTYITINYDDIGTLFVASHIKGFSDPNTTNAEKFDINNGLLISSNADALFDKHLISINQNKELIFSYLFDNNALLKSKLLLLEPIFKPILNEQRMKYLAYHEEIFRQKESQRRKAR